MEFKVGDKVRCIGNDKNYGKCGTISHKGKTHKINKTYYIVDFAEYIGNGYWDRYDCEKLCCHEEYLELK